MGSVGVSVRQVFPKAMVVYCFTETREGQWGAVVAAEVLLVRSEEVTKDSGGRDGD